MYKPCILLLLVLAVAVTPSLATFDWDSDDDDRRVPANVDFIVLGVGTSGSVVASQLASAKKSFGRFKYDVLAIEIGKDLTGSELTSNSGNWQGVKASEGDWDVTIGPNEPFAKLNDLDKKHITQGRTLGGCSAINSAMFVRGDPDDYNRWGTANPGWSFNDVLPYFKALENNGNKYATNAAFHGNAGPLRVNGSVYHERLAPFITAAENFGMTYNPDINGEHLITSPKGSIGRIDMTTADRVRQNAWHSFLRPLRDQDNLYIRDQSYVLKINFQGNTARSVTWLDTTTGESHTTRARREIIVSMGAIRSPQLLMLSGVGAKADLQALGIPVVKNLPGVGQNLQDHPIATFGTFSNNLPACMGNGQDPRLDFYFRTSQKPANDMRPDIEVIGSNACNNNFALVYLMSPKSRGYVKLATRDPTARPIVQPLYFSDAGGVDMKALIEGIQMTKDLYAQAPIFGFPIYGPANYSDPVGLATYILGTSSVNANTNSGNHLAGTCKMGPASDPTAVVDNRLRVHGVNNLRVIDNSIHPEITSGNTQAPAYMIGMKGAAMILQDNN